MKLKASQERLEQRTTFSLWVGVVGEKRMSPDTVYRFDFEATEDQYDADQIGRNITVMKEAIRTFLSSRNDK